MVEPIEIPDATRELCRGLDGAGWRTPMAAGARTVAAVTGDGAAAG